MVRRGRNIRNRKGRTRKGAATGREVLSKRGNSRERRVDNAEE
jgi:hypothetical protein